MTQIHHSCVYPKTFKPHYRDTCTTMSVPSLLTIANRGNGTSLDVHQLMDGQYTSDSYTQWIFKMEFHSAIKRS